MGWGGRWERGSGWETNVNPWLIHVNVWQKLLQCCKVISLQLIKINGKKKTTILTNNLVKYLFLKYLKNYLKVYTMMIALLISYLQSQSYYKDQLKITGEAFWNCKCQIHETVLTVIKITASLSPVLTSIKLHFL